ncbi:FkbM family methyltransferase [Adhaeribacter radiodurans]|uniref:FkbM family methyltransferase n=1 Tax=Adhaeribacter radiodurans TaxID=2745197 RepID=A0A7L7L880_9BACT|nr:FkbM family methyltransferase [Adhaeribacter radiodurans]QMU28963.1 FkbM family methyltransferase [Adhaeribacter radiodurans]
MEEIIDKLFAEDVESAAARAAAPFDHLVKGRNLILIGSGNLGLKILRVLQKHDLAPIAFTDNNPAKWNSTLEGIPLLSPAEAAEKYKDNAVFMVCIWSPGHFYKKTKEQFELLGCKNVMHCSHLFWKYPQELLPHYHFDLPQNYLIHKDAIKAAYNLLADNESKAQYLAHLKARLFLDLEAIPLPSGEAQYFPENLFRYSEQEVFLDGGAFIGDTLKSFLDVYENGFTSYMALEPDPTNFSSLNQYVADLDASVRAKVKTLPYAVGNKREKLRFNATGGGGAVISDSGSVEVQCVTIDEEFGDSPPTFIKLDVEGAERYALQGALHIIQRYQPLIAVCIYHMPDCLWNILLYLQKINPEYTFYCRTYEGDGLDFVLYAVPVGRVI